jgi:acetolactate synthase-1/2/3 large subunit
MFRPVTKWARTATSEDDLEALLTEAIQTAVSAPSGPAYLGVPTDLLRAPHPRRGTELPRRAEPAEPTEAELDAAAALVDAAERPVLWIGGGAARSGAGAVIARFAERIGAPVLTTYSARGILPAGNPDLAPTTAHVEPIGALWDAADLVIAIGSDFDAMTTQTWSMPQPPAILAINVDPADAAKNYAVHTMLTGDAQAVTTRLVDRCAPNPQRSRLVRDRNRELAIQVQRDIKADDPAAAQLLAAVEHALPARTALVLDMCIAGNWLAANAAVPAGGSLLYPMGWGTLGYALPASLGAACSGVDRAVAVVGDGGFLFATGELAAIRQLELPLTIVVVDDGAYGIIKYDQLRMGVPPRGVDLISPDFVALSNAFGIPATRVPGFGEPFGTVLAEFTRTEGPNLIVVNAALVPPRSVSPRWYRTRARG